MVQDDIKYPSWKWVVAILILAVGFLVAQGLTSINAQIDRKVDKLTYEADQRRAEVERVQLQKDLNEVKEMVGCIYRWHLPKELRDKK